jgi:hypothetical protein
MPFGDGTGPMGFGPRTGRGAGNCAGFGQGAGRFFGRASRGLEWFGRGRGCRNWYVGSSLTYTAGEEKAVLESRAAMLAGQLEEVRSRISDLEKNAKQG